MKLLVAALLVLPLTAAATERAWNFRVLLDGREIGRHGFTLAESGARRELVSDARFDVRMLFVSVYSYAHRAVEHWQGDCLASLEAITDTNGKVEEVRASAGASGLVVERSSGREEHAGCVMSFAYWNPRILGAKRLLNSQTGEVLPVTIAALGTETLAAAGGPLPARRYRLTAPDLSIDLWYAGERWIALEALAKGGGRLRYELL